MDVITLDKGWKEPLVSFLSEISPDLPRPLIGRVDLAEYADKLLDKGYVVAMADGSELVGICGGYANDLIGKRSVVTIMGVRAAIRKGGEGTRLMNCFIGLALKHGMRTLELETHETNLGAIAFYERNGFSLIEHLQNGNVLMRKRILGLSEKRPNILLTSVGRRAYLVEWFKDALDGRGEVHVMNSSPLSPAFAVADKSTVSPLIYSEEYIPFLVDYIRENRIGALLSLFDVDIPVLSKNKAAFESEGCLPVVADLSVAEFCNDKYGSYVTLKENGISTAPTFLDPDSCERSLKDGDVAFPLVVKPRWGMGSIGVAAVNDAEELRAAYGMVKNKIESSYLRYESSADRDKCVLIQGRMDGQEYGLDIINDLDGRYRSVVVRKKIAMRAGETDVAEVIPADERFEELARRISSMSHHPGNMDVDVFEAEGELRVLEMNARFGGGYPFSHAAGVDLPGALVSWLRGEEVSDDILRPKRYGTYLKDIRIISAPDVDCGTEAVS